MKVNFISKWDKRFLGLAEYISNWSKDPSTKVGAVITDKDRRVISFGFNGFAKNVIDSNERYNNREIKLKLILHAEENALIFSQRDLSGCSIFTWPFLPCSKCASQIIQYNIKRVVAPYNENPRWIESHNLSREIFKEAGVELIEYEEKT
jgi:dCMP deaminase